MKILFLHPAIRRYRAPLFERLAEIGVEFLFTSVNPSGTHAGEETEALLESFTGRYVQAREWSWFPARNASLDLLRVFRYDTVIFSSVTSVPFVALAGLLKKLGKRVLVFDEIWRYQHEVPRYARLLPRIRKLVRRADAVIVAGSRARRLFLEEFGVDPERVFVAYNTSPGPEPANPGEGGRGTGVRAAAGARPVVLYLGRLVEYKGLDVLIRALSAAEADAFLAVVGEGPHRQECERLVERLGLSDRVRFFGPCGAGEAAAYYESADIFVLPTRFKLHDPVNCESWGFTVNEAMSAGLPVIVTEAVGAGYDLIREGETGLCVPPDDADALGRALRPLLEDPDRTRSMGEAGRRWLAERCNYEQSFGAFESALRMAGALP